MEEVLRAVLITITLSSNSGCLKQLGILLHVIFRGEMSHVDVTTHGDDAVVLCAMSDSEASGELE
jgi:hypothetical protein